MQNKDIDEVLSKVLLNASSTRAFLKRLKKAEPKRWAYVYGNIYRAYHEIKPQKVNVIEYRIGIYNPEDNYTWPWQFDIDNGIFLSANYRQCKFAKAAVFKDKDAARVCFHNWKSKRNLKMELIETETIKFVDN